METPISILNRYWHHSQFRPLQEDIVNAVLNGRDTLALLPTGGGKSVCFQVPALIREGICIVITPLIALMKDQVEQLKSSGILAVAIHSGMSRSEIDILLDNCIYGSVKFLYVSPERLQTELFIERARQMKVGLIAVDEAHCISQWGYDFRPPYLQITSLRELKPQVPVIALTATATLQVKDDIMQKLAFREPAGIFQRSFARDNLSFVVRKTENKEKKLLDILQKVKGTAIIYVRSRKATQQIAEWLSKRNIPASYYHAGLSFEERSKRQEDWIQNRSRVMVATNAFGMGIDKPDVRLVVHLDLPENLESYYQEAGRAGRDGVKSFAVILYQEADVVNLQFKTEQAHPSPETLKKVYQALANYYQLAVGSSGGESYDFDLHDFAERFHYNQQEVYIALKKLEEEGLIQFNESFYNPSHLFIPVDKTKLYEFQIANARFDPVIKMLLRLYGGELFADFVKISESYLAKGLKISEKEMISILKHLNEMKIVSYQPLKDKPQITFVLPRQDVDRLPLNIKRLEERKKLTTDKMQAIVTFATTTHRCRMQIIQDYFGEDTFAECGLCDVCIEKRKHDNRAAFDDIRSEIITILRGASMTIEQLEEQIEPANRELFADAVRDLVDEGILQYDDAWQLRFSEPRH
ncbi:MAG TPA: RecQ family ATP-dependent DNA helicase [Ohtaekwangia sp.]|uniref:RecQ family ATP-dependent DNA helicase n=1 Tax=Ohtaekwangia sp. TaxID=2066019 RepID=UPI002F92C66C